MNQRGAFERVVAALNEAMLDDSAWPETSALIDAACGARGSILAFGDETSTDDLEIFFFKCYYDGEDRSEWLREYFRLYYPVAEHLPRLRKLPDSKIVRVADLFSREELKTSLAYNEGLRRFKSHNGLNVRLDGPGGSSISWTVGNPVDANSWSSSRIDMVRRLLPHLRQYVRVRSALAESRALGASASELLNKTSVGVVQFDRRGRIVEMNDAAWTLVGRNDGLSDEGRTLRAAGPKDDARLGDLLARALPCFGDQGTSGSMTVSRPSSLPMFALHVMPVASRDSGYRTRNVAALAIIVDPVSRAQVDLDLVAAVLGLTPAEAGIAVLLAEGRTPRQIAEVTGRGYSTVRTHLKNIFIKLGMSRQYEVAQILLALSGLPESRD